MSNDLVPQGETTPTPSPSLADLFSIDPLKLTQPDVAQICLELRKQRETWLQEEAAVKVKGSGRVSTKIASKPKAAKGKLSEAEFAALGLGDLLAQLSAPTKKA